MSEPYFCPKCQRHHKPGSKVYDMHIITPDPHVMVVETPTREEILKYIDDACAKAAIPADVQPTTITPSGSVERWEPRMAFQKDPAMPPDRVVESMQHEPVPAMRHGEPVKKRKWWRSWRRG